MHLYFGGIFAHLSDIGGGGLVQIIFLCVGGGLAVPLESRGDVPKQLLSKSAFVLYYIVSFLACAGGFLKLPCITYKVFNMRT